jgi:hypothetical protein
MLIPAKKCRCPGAILKFYSGVNLCRFADDFYLSFASAQTSFIVFVSIVLAL